MNSKKAGVMLTYYQVNTLRILKHCINNINSAYCSGLKLN